MMSIRCWNVSGTREAGFAVVKAVKHRCGLG